MILLLYWTIELIICSIVLFTKSHLLTKSCNIRRWSLIFFKLSNYAFNYFDYRQPVNYRSQWCILATQILFSTARTLVFCRSVYWSYCAFHLCDVTINWTIDFSYAWKLTVWAELNHHNVIYLLLLWSWC